MKRSRPKVKMISSEEVEEILKITDATLPPEAAKRVRQIAETVALFSEEDLRGETSLEELEAKFLKSPFVKSHETEESS